MDNVQTFASTGKYAFACYSQRCTCDGHRHMKTSSALSLLKRVILICKLGSWGLPSTVGVGFEFSSNGTINNR